MEREGPGGDFHNPKPISMGRGVTRNLILPLGFLDVGGEDDGGRIRWVRTGGITIAWLSMDAFAVDTLRWGTTCL